ERARTGKNGRNLEVAGLALARGSEFITEPSPPTSNVPRPTLFQLTGGTRSSGGTKFDRKRRSCGVRLPRPLALILSRMRFTSSRLTEWIDVGSTRFQLRRVSGATLAVVF